MSTLAGCRVVVTRPRARAAYCVELLQRRGAEVILLPTIRIEGVADDAPLDEALRRMRTGAYLWVAFTSANAVEHMARRASGAAGEAFGRVRVAAVGGATAAALRALGVEVEVVPARADAAGLAAALGPGAGAILLPRAEQAPPTLIDLLEAAGWQTHPLTVYRTSEGGERPPLAAAVESGAFDVVTFTSGSTARGFARWFPDLERIGLGAGSPPPASVCIGDITAQEAARAGFRVDAVAEDASDEGLVAAVEEHWPQWMGR